MLESATFLGNHRLTRKWHILKKFAFLFFVLQFTGISQLQAVDIGNNESQIGYYIRQAARAIEEQQFIESVIFCSYAIKVDSLHADAWYLRSYSYYCCGTPAKALPDIKTAISINDENASYWLLKAKINYAMHNYWEAWRDFRRARKLDPLMTTLAITSVFSPILPGKK